jgi:hypothetical protein
VYVPDDKGTVEEGQRHDVVHDHDGKVTLLRVEEEVSVDSVQVPPDLQRVVEADLGPA